MPSAAIYPATPSARDRFVLERRGPRIQHDPWRAQGVIVEDEPAADGSCARVATVFLTGRECPWCCAMCDLWKHTTATDTPAGAIPSQIAATRAAIRDDAAPITAMKLYNAGSFFDPRAVPESDYEATASALVGISHLIVESHPSVVGTRVDRLLDALARHPGADSSRATLEVAMGLETAHEAALDRLNKHFSLARFAQAASALAERRVALRVFLLISPPFIPRVEQDSWLLRSIDLAFSLGASVVSLVPTRSGNGAIEALADAGSFEAPTLDDIERSFALALTQARGRGRVLVDVWDLERFAHCRDCFIPRCARLRAMNLAQRVLPACSCSSDQRSDHQ
jgi:radical SAM enzyme (TIGR01210 family)